MSGFGGKLGITALLLALAPGALPALAGSSKTALVSRTSAGVPGDGESGSPVASASGRYVAFASEAPNLPGSDSDQSVYLADRRTGRTVLVSKTSDGEPAVDGNSNDPSISASGRFIAFRSGAANLPAGGVERERVYVHDRKTDTTRLVSKTSAGEPDNGYSDSPSISASGRYVSFRSTATNLPGNDSFDDIYVHDRKTGKTELMSRNSGGKPANADSRPDNSISPSGRYVGFSSAATNFPGNPENTYIHDRRTGKTRVVSKTSDGEPATGNSSYPAISATGRYVSFVSSAANLPGDDSVTDAFVHDRETGRTRLVSKTSAGDPASASALYTRISASGRYVAFNSEATNLPGNDLVEDVYTHDRKTGSTRLVSRSTTGDPASGGDSFLGSLTPSGDYVTFSSEATNLAGNPEFLDAYIRGPLR
jgi:Tol biopolymer transport system component